MNNESGLILKIDGFKDFTEAIRQLDKVIEDIDSRLNAAGDALSGFIRRAKTTNNFSKFVNDLGILFRELNKFQRSSSRIAQSLNSLTHAFDDLFGVMSRRNGIAQFTHQINELIPALRQLNRIQLTGLQIRRLGEDVTAGFRQGFSSLATTARERAQEFIDRFAKILGIRSPSTVFRGFGRDIVRGLVQGIGSLASTALGLGRDFARSFLRGLGNLRSEIQSFSRDLAQTAQNSIQRGLQTITAGGIVSFAQARVIQLPLMSAVDFEDAFAGVIKTVNVEDLGQEAGGRFLDGLREGLRDLSTGENPLAGLENAQIELARIAESAGQLGVARDDVLEFTETVGQLSLATNIVGQEGATQLAQFANIVQTTEFDRIGSSITALGNTSATTESQILEFAQRLAGAGDSANLSEAEILAIGAAMASLGLNAEAGSSAFNQFLTELTKVTAQGGEELNSFARVARVEADNFAETFRTEPVDAIQQFVDGLGQLSNEEQVQVLDSLNLDGLRLADTLRRLSGNSDLLQRSLATANTAWVENNALTEEAQKRFETTRSQINRARNVMRDLGITIGNTLLPDFGQLLDQVSDLGARFNEFAESNPILVRHLGRAAIAVGGVAAGLVTLAGALGIIGGGLLSTVAGGIGLVTGSFTALTAVFFNPIGVIAGLGAITATVATLVPALLAIVGVGLVGFRVLQRVVDDVRNNVGGAGDSFNLLRDSVVNLFSVVRDLLGPAFSFFNGVLNTILDGLFGVRSEVDTLSGTIEKSGLAQFFDFIANRVNALANQLQRVSGVLQSINVFAGFAAGPTAASFGEIGGVQISEKTASLEDRRTQLTERRLRLIERINELESGVSGELEAQTTVLVKQGDTLSEIASRAGLSIEDILSLNPEIADPNRIFAGQELRLSAGLQIDSTEEFERLHRELGEVERQLGSAARQFASSLGADRLFNALSQSEQIVQRLTGSQIFQDVFGAVGPAEREALVGAIEDIDTALGNIQTYAGFVPGALRQIFAGDITSGLSGLQTIFAGVGRNIRSMFTAVDDAINGGHQPLVALTGEPGAQGGFGFGARLADRIGAEINQMGPQLAGVGIQSRFEDVLRTYLLPILGSAATLVFGPVGGLVVGIGSLLVKAIEDDFLGLGTLIEQSGIQAALEGAMNTLKGLFNGIFGLSRPDTPLVALTSVGADSGGFFNNPFVQQISGMIDGLKTTLQGVGTILGPAFSTATADIASGIGGFFTAIQTVDGEKVRSILDVVGSALNTFLQWIGISGTLLLGNIGTVVETALPAIGGAAAGFINAVGSLAGGDIQGVLSGLGSGLSSIASGALNLTAGLADNLISFLERITGAQLPSVDEGIGAIVNGLSGLVSSVPTVLENTRAAAERAFNNLRLGFELKFAELLFSVLIEANRIGAELRRGLEEIVRPLNDLAAGLGLQPIVIDESAFEIDTTHVEERLRVLNGLIAENNAGDLTPAGNDLGQGLIDGIVATIPDADAATRDLINNGIKNPITEELETQSPSQWAIRAMGDLIMGFVIGIGINSILLAIAIGSISLQFQLLRSTVSTQAQGMARDFDLSANRIVSAAGRIAAAINAARNQLAQAQASGVNVPGFATGGVAQGLAWVGERGRELIFAGREMSVLNNKTSEALALGYRMGMGAAGGLQGFLQQSGLFGGWRQFGGDVSANRFYGFSEDGRPEVFQGRNGQQYLLSPTGGAITPLREASTAPITTNHRRSVDNSIHVDVHLPNGKVSSATLRRIEEAVANGITRGQRGPLTRRANRRGVM